MKPYLLSDVKLPNNQNRLTYATNTCNRRVKVVGPLRSERFESLIVFVKFS